MKMNQASTNMYKLYIIVEYNNYVPSLPELVGGVGFKKVSMVWETLMAASTHTMGVRVSIRRTITPAKYTAETAYRITGMWTAEK